MADDPGGPVELYRARGPAEAYTLCAHLEVAGVVAHIDNEMLQGVVGEVPGGWVTAPRVLVPAAALETARSVLDEFLQRAEETTDEPDDVGLRCFACRAPMGQAATCPACGWSYGPEGDEAPTLVAVPPTVDQPTAVSPDTPVMATLPAVPGGGWGEVLAVLCVGVIPNLIVAVTRSAFPTPAPYWEVALDLAGISACTIFVTLYLIQRSGEPWSRFGLDRPEISDPFVGVAMVLVA